MLVNIITKHICTDEKYESTTKRAKNEVSLNLFIRDTDRQTDLGGYLGLDPSLTSFGYFFTKDGVNFVSGRLKSDKKGSGRLKEIAVVLKNLVLKLKPSNIYLEDYSYDSPFKAHDLGELGGYVRTILDEYCSIHPEVKYIKLPPNSNKLFFTGDGKAKKKKVKEFVPKIFGFFLSSEDEADAAALCYASMNSYIPPPKPPKKKRKPKATQESGEDTISKAPIKKKAVRRKRSVL